MVNTSLLYFWPVAEGWEELCERRTAMCAPCATLHGSDTSIPRLLAGFAASCDRCRAVRNRVPWKQEVLLAGITSG